MTEALFGAPPGLFQRLQRDEVRVADVRAAACRLADEAQSQRIAANAEPADAVVFQRWALLLSP